MFYRILFILFLFWYFYFQDQGFFRVIERYYCKKCNHDCSKCKAWSCFRR